VRHPHAGLALSWPTRRIVLWALLWSLLVSAAEFVVIAPLHSMPPLAFLAWWLMVWSVPLWCLLGCALLWLARAAERRGDWRALVIGGLAICAVWAVLQPINTVVMNALLRDSTRVSMILSGTGFDAPSIAQSGLPLLAYNLWTNLFYGGLLVSAYVLSVRTERTRALLREAALSRGRTEALLGELRLQEMQAQIDPALLLAGLDEVQRLYPQHGDRADALLERLVDFLRAAMPGLKHRGSSLRAELHLAQAFARLQALMPLGARWQIELPRELPELAFPSLLLLPIMALAGPNDAPRLVVRLEDARVSLQVQALGCELPAQVELRTRSSLTALSPTLRMRANDSPQTQLLIELEPALAPTEFAHEPRLA